MRNLVVGGNGLIGSHIVEILLNRGKRVKVISKPGSSLGTIEPYSDDIEVVECDIRDRESIGIAMKKCDYVYHLAASHLLWERDSRIYQEVNVSGTRNVADAAVRNNVKRIVYTSTCDIMGRSQRKAGKLGDEDGFPDGDLNEIGPYGRSKIEAEKVLRKKTNGIEVIVVHPTCPIGKNDTLPTEPGKMIEAVIQGNLGGYVDRRMNFVHVKDCALGHVLAMERGVHGERYILGGENIELKNFIERVAKLAGVRAPRIAVPYFIATSSAYLFEFISKITGKRPKASIEGVGLIRHDFVFSSEKAKRELGYTTGQLNFAIEEAVDWHRKRLNIEKKY